LVVQVIIFTVGVTIVLNDTWYEACNPFASLSPLVAAQLLLVGTLLTLNFQPTFNGHF